MDWKIVIIVSLVWVIGCLIYYTYTKRKVVVKVEGDVFKPRDIIEFPRELSITIVFQEQKDVSEEFLTDLVVKYSDLLSGKYIVPDKFRKRNIEDPLPVSKQEEAKLDDRVGEEELVQPDNDIIISEDDLSEIITNGYIPEHSFEEEIILTSEENEDMIDIKTLEEGFNPFESESK